MDFKERMIWNENSTLDIVVFMQSLKLFQTLHKYNNIKCRVFIPNHSFLEIHPICDSTASFVLHFIYKFFHTELKALKLVRAERFIYQQSENAEKIKIEQ